MSILAPRRADRKHSASNPAGCPDLRALAADKYRVQRDESYVADHGIHVRAADPWLLTIPCLHGHVFPFAEGMLGASTDRRGGIAGRLAALPGCRVHQDGDDGLTVVFPAAMFETVAEILKPRRRRRWSEAQRARAFAEGRLLGAKPRVQIDFGEQTRDIAVRLTETAISATNASGAQFRILAACGKTEPVSLAVAGVRAAVPG